MKPTFVTVLEKYDMVLDPRPSKEKWFLDWALNDPSHSSAHVTAAYHAFRDLQVLYGPDGIQSAVEYFGGMGCFSLALEEMFDLTEHTIVEFSEDAYLHLLQNVPLPLGQRSPASVQIVHGDSYSPKLDFPADLVVLDFGDLTAWRTREGESGRLLLDKAFGSMPRAVEVTDIACRYLHLHRERYETLLGPGTCWTYETYLRSFADRIEALYGYSLLTGYFHRWSSVMVFVPPEEIQKPGVIWPVPAYPIGLQIF